MTSVEPLTPDDPSSIGPFSLVGRLGAGGMGMVYLGRDADGRRAAVKVVHPHLAADRSFRTRFAREVGLARAVDARWAARVVDAEPESARPWLATEYVEGPDLDEHVTTAGPLSAAAVAELGSKLADALTELHGRGIVRPGRRTPSRHLSRILLHRRDHGRWRARLLPAPGRLPLPT